MIPIFLNHMINQIKQTIVDHKLNETIIEYDIFKSKICRYWSSDSDLWTNKSIITWEIWAQRNFIRIYEYACCVIFYINLKSENNIECIWLCKCSQYYFARLISSCIYTGCFYRYPITWHSCEYFFLRMLS